MYFFICGEEERNYFLSPVTTARKRKLLSKLFAKYTIYSSPAHSPILRNGKIWRPNGRTTLSETMKYQMERDTPDTQPQNHCQTWDLKTKRPNFERHRTRWKKLWKPTPNKCSKKWFERKKTYLNAGKGRQSRTQTSEAHRAGRKKKTTKKINTKLTITTNSINTFPGRK